MKELYVIFIVGFVNILVIANQIYWYYRLSKDERMLFEKVNLLIPMGCFIVFVVSALFSRGSFSYFFTMPAFLILCHPITYMVLATNNLILLKQPIVNSDVKYRIYRNDSMHLFLKYFLMFIGELLLFSWFYKTFFIDTSLIYQMKKVIYFFQTTKL